MKPSWERNRFGIRPFNGHHLGRSGPAMAPLHQPFYAFACPLGNELNGSIWAISNPAIHTNGPGELQ